MEKYHSDISRCVDSRMYEEEAVCSFEILSLTKFKAGWVHNVFSIYTEDYGYVLLCYTIVAAYQHPGHPSERYLCMCIYNQPTYCMYSINIE